MSFPRRIPILAALPLSLAFTACGDDDSDKPDADTGAPGDDTGETAAPLIGHWDLTEFIDTDGTVYGPGYFTETLDVDADLHCAFSRTITDDGDIDVHEWSGAATPDGTGRTWRIEATADCCETLVYDCTPDGDTLDCVQIEGLGGDGKTVRYARAR
jgi:hypothetical protein